MDRYGYNRLSAWYCFKYGATGNRFWCHGGARSAWNVYGVSHGGASVLSIISETDVTTGKHWEVVREGIEDYEYLCMLRDRIEQLGAETAAVAEAEEVLSGAFHQVIPGDFSQ